VREIFKRHTDLIEPPSLDEALPRRHGKQDRVADRNACGAHDSRANPPGIDQATHWWCMEKKDQPEWTAVETSRSWLPSSMFNDLPRVWFFSVSQKVS
jgi:hypothetical protein